MCFRFERWGAVWGQALFGADGVGGGDRGRSYGERVKGGVKHLCSWREGGGVCGACGEGKCDVSKRISVKKGAR
ncbi:hypothetical protein [Bartonella raoultii]|uniref:hypothetical protein n=1 Tax=Bartonella raoultii TaxID=1457020 RepID=UPI001ABB73F6|nr:hypothetical protein [Bartonella raoultii]